MFIIKVIGMSENTRFLLFLFSSATSLLTATGKPRLAIAIRRVKVGVINMYTPVPSVLSVLARTIFINMLIIFVSILPIVSIITDFMNLFFFMFNFMFFKNYLYVFSLKRFIFII